jgi:hypothetical protein
LAQLQKSPPFPNHYVAELRILYLVAAIVGTAPQAFLESHGVIRRDIDKFSEKRELVDAALDAAKSGARKHPSTLPQRSFGSDTPSSSHASPGLYSQYYKKPLSQWVKPREAVVFQFIAGAVVHQHADVFSGDIEGQCSAVCTAVEDVLGVSNVVSEVIGSQLKGTSTADSDIDVSIHVPGHVVTRQEQEKIVARLKGMAVFERAHIRLKRQVILCSTAEVEIDFVFVGTDGYGHFSGYHEEEDYGHLPGRLESQLKRNRAAQNAARLLKWGLKQSHLVSKRVPSFILEMLAIEAQSRADDRPSHDAAPNTVADGSMQLFCEVLQLLVDAPGRGRILNDIQHTWFDEDRDRHTVSESMQTTMYEYAKLLLHRFCVSRV